MARRPRRSEPTPLEVPAVIIWGFRGRVKPIASIRTRCPRCGQEAAHRLVRSQRWFTLFFIPIFPFSSRYISTCTYCGTSLRVESDVAKRFEAQASSAQQLPSPQPQPQAGAGLAPPGAPISEDGRWWWDGRAWQPRLTGTVPQPGGPPQA